MYGNFFHNLHRSIWALAAACTIAVGVFFFNMLRMRPTLDVNALMRNTSINDEENEFRLLPNFDWSAPMPCRNDGPWMYEIFTPPAIELKGGRLIAHVPGEGNENPVLKLTNIDEIPYRLQLEGFVKDSTEELHIFIRDRHTDKLYAMNSGTAAEEADFFVQDCELAPTDADASSATSPIVRVLDGRDGSSHLLAFEDVFAEKNFIAEIAMEYDGDRQFFHLEHIGDTFSAGQETYELVYADPQQHLVTIREIGDNTLLTLSY
ncbi:MAG: hypothetical protein LBC42_00485 [Puniceicoccales bacterium]|jgi:hypothetical protein|nr:hypothetical protein [Puniceicoccales bacterium]